ncbi:MAG: FUN14 family protein [Candidatus Bathyarchaeota archaeon BA2]|nr:MAG: FUN14 family protein [Candidatus Bathyarchaeota archaeon BA2]
MKKYNLFLTGCRVNQIVSEAFAPILFQLGLGGIGGFFIGYAVRKVFKIALIIGIIVFSLIFLAYIGVIGVDYGGFADAVSKFINAVNPALGLLAPLLSNIIFIGSLIIGLIAGYKMS